MLVTFQFSLIFFLVLGGAVRAASPQNLSQHPHWLRLLHYQSKADGLSFFFSPFGADDPASELEATLTAFALPDLDRSGPNEQHPLCAFPARAWFLSKHLGLKMGNPECTAYQTWKKNLKTDHVFLDFAAPTSGDPASLFGHTFLRISGKGSAMLGHAISFEASTGVDGSSMIYAVKGLLGFYPGSYSVVPYTVKVSLYRGIEDRDIWEYELNLTEEQRELLLMHLWEMGSTYFNYYFFTKNCSYQLLTFLEALDPNWDLVSRLSMSAIPANTLRAVVEQKNLVLNRHREPSVLKVVDWRLQSLNESDREKFFDLKNKKIDPAGLSLGLLDTLLDWQKFVVLNESRTLYDSEKQIQHAMLVARSKIQEKNTFQIEEKINHDTSTASVSPEKGHLSSKLGLQIGADQRSPYLGLMIRPAYHDALDADAGYMPFSILTLAKTTVQYTVPKNSSRGKWRLEEFIFAEAGSLTPYDRLRQNRIWMVRGRLYHPNDLNCEACLVGQAHGSYGFHLYPIYGQAHGRVEFGSFPYLARLAPSLELGSIVSLGARYKTQVRIESQAFFSNSFVRPKTRTEAGMTHSLSVGSWNPRLSGTVAWQEQKTHWGFQSEIGWYF